MKRTYILGFFLGALMLFSYEPAAQAMPASGLALPTSMVRLQRLIMGTRAG